MKEKANSKENTIENFLNSLDYSLALLERFGAFIISIGYLGYVYASNIDILDIKGINYTRQIPEAILLNAQKIITIGYIFLYFVAKERAKEKDTRFTNNNQNISALPYEKVATSYLISVIGHFLRLEAFAEIYSIVINQRNNSSEDTEDSEDDD